METIRDQLAEALYQKGLALAEIEPLKVVAVALTCVNCYVSMVTSLDHMIWLSLSAKCRSQRFASIYCVCPTYGNQVTRDFWHVISFRILI